MRLDWEPGTSLYRVWRGRRDGELVAEVMKTLGAPCGARPWRVWLRGGLDKWVRQRGSWSTAERAMAAAERMVER